MRRVTLIVVAILLAVPAVASAKVGVGFDRDPATIKPGKKVGINIIAMRMPRGPNGGDPKPIAGEHPLVTFRSATSGKVLRVRGALSTRDGISRATVAFPDRGPWSAVIRIKGRVLREGGHSDFGGFQVGVRPPEQQAVVDEVVRPPAEAPSGARASDGGSGSALPWLLAGLAAALGALGLAAVRLGIPARLRARLGGGA